MEEIARILTHIARGPEQTANPDQDELMDLSNENREDEQNVKTAFTGCGEDACYMG